MTAILRLMGRRADELLVDERPLNDAGLIGKDEVAADGSSVAVIALPSGDYTFAMPR